MAAEVAVNIEYWAEQDTQTSVSTPPGMPDFVAELQQYYVARVHGRPADLGGGLYELAVQVIAAIPMEHVVKLIADGVAFDLLKLGARSFVFRPLLQAYERLRSRATDRPVGIRQLSFVFQDAELTITSLPNASLYDQLGQVFRVLTERYDDLRANGSAAPYEIVVPVFEDPTGEVCRFRQLLDVDETIANYGPESYLGFWGARYDFDRAVRVYDVRQRSLIDIAFLTVDQYWKAWDEHRRARGQAA